MAIKQETFVIDGASYTVSTFPATKGIQVLKQLTKLIGPSIAQMFTPAEDGESNVSLAMEALLDHIDDVAVDSLLQTLITGVTKDNMAISFDTEFSGNYLHLFNLAKKVVEVNYGDLFQLAGFAE